MRLLINYRCTLFGPYFANPINPKVVFIQKNVRNVLEHNFVLFMFVKTKKILSNKYKKIANMIHYYIEPSL